MWQKNGIILERQLTKLPKKNWDSEKRIRTHTSEESREEANKVQEAKERLSSTENKTNKEEFERSKNRLKESINKDRNTYIEEIARETEEAMAKESSSLT